MPSILKSGILTDQLNQKVYHGPDVYFPCH